MRVAALAFGLVLAGFASGHIVRGAASFLVIEDPLQPAAAIISLGGKLPFREIEAARLYREGWAPQVIIVRATPSAEYEALRALEIDKPQEWELSREVLKQQGVPASAIVIPKEEGVGTLEELQAAWDALQHGAWSMEHEADRTPKTQDPIPNTLNAARNSHAQRDNAINATNAKDAARNNALPVILVTSKYHTRRTRLTWQYVTGGRSQPIVRAASLDPFDPEHWWQERRSILAVVREYLGLLNYYAGFPVTG